MIDDINYLPQHIREKGSYRQSENLKSHYRQYIEWLLEKGKDPSQNAGFAPKSAEVILRRTQQFHQCVWNWADTYTTRFTHTHANRFEQALDEDTVRTKEGEPYEEGSKRKLQGAVATYFTFRAYRHGGEPWSPKLEFSQTEYDKADYFTLDERERLQEASLTYDDLGEYNNLSPQDRDRAKEYLAQKLGKPKSEVAPADFESCRTSWKIPSLISVTLDIGARPVFFERCIDGWYKPEKGVFQIPKDESPKNDSYWEPTLSSRSTDLLDRWNAQRETISLYDDSRSLWLNREGNPYRSGTLNYLLDNLIEEANIDQTNRKLTWTSIRRSTGTYLTYFRSIAYAKQQLRHKSLQSTLQYAEIPVEARQKALDGLQGALTEINSGTSVEGHSAPLEVLQ